MSKFIWNKDISFGKNMTNAYKSGDLDPAIGLLSTLTGNALSGGLSSGVGKVALGLGSVAGLIPGVGPLAGAALNIAGGITNRLIGSQINDKAVQDMESANEAQSNMAFSAASNEDLLALSNFGLLDKIKRSDVGKDGLFSNKAKNLTARLNRERELANLQALANYNLAVDSLDTLNDLNILANYAANGGPLDNADNEPWYAPLVKNLPGALLKEGKYQGNIYTNPELRRKYRKPEKGVFGGGTFGGGAGGRFTPTKDYTSIGTFNEAFDRAYSAKESEFKYGEKYYNTNKENNPIREFNNRVAGNSKSRARLKEKDSYEHKVGPLGYKGLELIPIITQDYRKKAEGGPLHTQGGIWDNGLTYINAGGTHEENPMEGVMMGMDSQGVPNLVELGEVVWNDYVFSNRLKVPKKTREAFKLGNSDITFADAAKKLSKESEERPNDPISKNSVDNMLSRLVPVLELLRVRKSGNKYAKGGKLGKEFAGVGHYAQFLSTETPRNNAGNGLKSGSTTNTNYLTNLRYAPVLGAAIGLGLNLFSSPDYSDYNTLMREAENAGSYTPIRPTLINDYLTYNPIDRAWATNKLNAQASAGRRAIVNLSAGNRATALAGLVAHNYNTQQGLGDLLLNADMYNNQLRERVATFNRATNQTNADLGLRAAMANQEAALKHRGLRLEGINKAIAMRNAIDSARAASMSANLSNLFDSLGNIGREEFAKQMIQGNKSLLYDWFGRYKDLILDDLNG